MRRNGCEDRVGMDAGQQHRIAANESLFRTHNERRVAIVKEFHESMDGAEAADHRYMCECAVRTCDESILLTVLQYEEARTDVTWFVVKPNHIVTRAERLLRDHGHYWIIAKTGPAGEAADAMADSRP